MRWRISGAYVTSCCCQTRAHRALDGSLSDTPSACEGVAAFWVKEGSFGEYDLSAVAFAIYNFFPPRISSGSWEVALVVDPAVGNEQMLSLERIALGRDGGPFSSIVGLVGEYLGLERADIRFSGQEWPSVLIDEHGSFRFQPVLGDDGDPLVAAHAMFPFAEGCVVGHTTGTHFAFGHTWKSGYGEYARYDFNDETLGVEQRLGRGR
jgi:hypothetical protein